MGCGDESEEGVWRENRKNALNDLERRIAWWMGRGLRVWSEEGEVGVGGVEGKRSADSRSGGWTWNGLWVRASEPCVMEYNGRDTTQLLIFWAL